MLIFSYVDFYHQALALLRQLCHSTLRLAHQEDLRTFCVLYSGSQLHFDLASERNLVQLAKPMRLKRLYYKELVLRNWRYPNNDL